MKDALNSGQLRTDYVNSLAKAKEYKIPAMRGSLGPIHRLVDARAKIPRGFLKSDVPSEFKLFRCLT